MNRMSFNFDDEEICGHLVTKDMKKLWSVEMDISQKLLNVCAKYDLKIWAAAGTLLGAVRHKGFIPWDDDMDFCMMREDYEKLMEVGPSEFQYPYFFQSFHTDNFWGGMAKIRNSETAMVERNFEKRVEFNRGVFVDILVMDAIPDDLSEMKHAYNRNKFLRKVLYGYKVVDYSHRSLWIRIMNFFMRVAVSIIGANNIDRFVERQTAKYNGKNCKKIAPVGFHLTEGHDMSRFEIVEKHCYDETVWLPFHDMLLPAPKGYDKVLTDLFGDYMTPIKAKSDHCIVLVDCDRSYKDVMKDLR